MGNFHYKTFQQFIICIWRIFFGNILRKGNFYVSMLVSLIVITICLFWPSTAYLVIIGETIVIPSEIIWKPIQPHSFTLFVGTMISNESQPQTIKLYNRFYEYFENKNKIRLCKDMKQCEAEIEYRGNPILDKNTNAQSDDKNSFVIYVHVDNNSIPNILLRFPFHYAIKKGYFIKELMPFKMLMDKIILKEYFNLNLSVEYGIIHEKRNSDRSKKSKLLKEDAHSKHSPLTKFSVGVMATHFYLGATCLIIHMVSSMVNDKETDMRSINSIMGLHRIAYISSYTVVYFILVIVICLYTTLIVALFPNLINDELRTPLTYFKSFLNYLFCGFLIIAQSFFISTLTRSVRIITFIVLFINCIQIIVGMTLLKFKLEQDSDVHTPVDQNASNWMNFIFPTIAFFNIQIELFTGSSSSANESNIYIKMSYLFLVGIIYFVIGCYFDIIINTGTGHSYPWYFPVSIISRTIKSKYKKNKEEPKILALEEHESFVQPVDKSLVQVELKHVQKTFKSFFSRKTVRAVRDVTLDLQEGMITAILGHNGAGKSTTFNILVGLLRPSSGSVRIYGLNPDDPWDKNKLNRMTSICMQSDILFPNLSCQEHIKYFGVVKGLNNEEILKEMTMLFTKLELKYEANKQASVLSGGQMRKLCVAIALLGNPKIVLLDEPTSGVDPISRRCIWNVLKEYKTNRVIILSTHYMDEADILADWKAIMVKGSVVCYGTSMFLKTKFNLGYVLTCTIDSTINDTRDIMNLISSMAPSAEFSKRYGMEITFKVSNDDIVELSKRVSSPEGIEMFKEHGILDYGISVTKLEEIFLKLGEYEQEEDVQYNDQYSMYDILNQGALKMKSEGSFEVYREGEIHKEPPSLDIPPPVLQNVNINIEKLNSSQFIIGFYQFWTFIRLNILLSIRTPLFAVVRSVGPFLSITLALVLFIFETRNPDKMDISIYNLSLPGYNSLPYYLFYNFSTENIQSNNKSREELNTDFVCLRQFYGSRFLYINETHKFKDIRGSSYLTINNWNEEKGYSLFFIYFRESQLISIVTFQNVLQNCLIHRKMGWNKLHFITVVESWSLKWTAAYHPSFKMTTAFVYMMALSVAFSIMNPVIAGDVVRDRMTNNLNQMTLYGLHYLSYWGAHFILHLLHFTMIMCVVICFMFLAKNYMYCDSAYVSIFSILYFLASTDNILLIYCLSFAFTDITSAEITFSFSLLIPMFSMSIMIFSPMHVLDVMHLCFLIFFPFLNPWMTMMFIDYRTRRLNQYISQSFTPTYLLNFDELLSYVPVRNSIIIHIAHIILLSIAFVGYNAYIFVIKRHLERQTLLELMRKPKLFDNIDSISTTVEGFVNNAQNDLKKNKDLIEEIIGSKESNKNVVGVVSDLTKIYNTLKKLIPREVEATVALSNMNLVINKSEIFGLLGPSGAGKTTAMNSISRIKRPTSGKVVVYDAITDEFVPAEVAISKNLIGLCPQTNPIWPNMTVREHLLVYSALRSIPRKLREKHSATLILMVQLTKYTNSLSSSLSGGCKRRLSLAISLTGFPQLILLDEPSCGVDPKSRRRLWDTISNAIHNTGKGALITTQFMEECEALCNRLGIIVNGRIMCIGSPQELKSKFGRGYSVEIKMPTTNNNAKDLVLKRSLTHFLLAKYPNLLTIEHFGERISYRIPKGDNASFGEVFELIHQAKDIYNLEDYAVSQPTLEQVYFDFARYQTRDDLKYDVQIKWKKH